MIILAAECKMSDPIASCPERARLESALDILDHDSMGGCSHCVHRSNASVSAETVAKREPESAELVAGLASTQEEKAQDKKLVAPARRFQRKDVKNEKQPDKLLVRKLVKDGGLDKSEAVLKLVEERRKENAAKSGASSEADKETVPADQLPFIPERIWCPPDKRSALPPGDHNRYVAIISNFLNAEVSFRFTLNKNEIPAWDARLAQERVEFEKYAMNYLEEKKLNPYRTFIAQSFKYCRERYFPRFLALSEDGYGSLVGELEWTNEVSRSSNLFIPKCPTVISHGRMPRLVLPDVRRCCQLPVEINAISEKNPPSDAGKDLIEQDEQAIETAVTNGLDFVLDETTVKHLLSMPWAYRDYKVGIKVSIRHAVHKGQLQRVCIFSKPVMTSMMQKPTYARTYLKWVVKSAIVKTSEAGTRKRKRVTTDRPVVVYEPRSPPPLAQDESDEEEQHATKKFKPESPDKDVSLEEVQLASDRAFKPRKVKMENKTKAPEKVDSLAKAEDTLFDDVLGGILSGMSGSTEGEKHAPEAASPNVVTDRRYAVLQVDSEHKHKVLVRTKNHGDLQSKKVVSYSVKPEYLPQIGAEKMDIEERLWNLLTVILKGAEEHINFRMHATNGHCLQIEHRTASTMTNDLDTRALLSTRSERLCRLFDALSKLDFGEYFLLQEEDKLQICQQGGEGIGEDKQVIAGPLLRERAMSRNSRFEDVTPRIAWKGVDVHVPLVWHIVSKRIPGSFPPKFEHSSGQSPHMPRDRKERNWKQKQRYRQNKKEKKAAANQQLPKIV